MENHNKVLSKRLVETQLFLTFGFKCTRLVGVNRHTKLKFCENIRSYSADKMSYEERNGQTAVQILKIDPLNTVAIITEWLLCMTRLTT